MKVPVKFRLKQGPVWKLFTLTLICTRLAPVEIILRLAKFGLRYQEFMLSEGVVTGWDGQRLVLKANGEPADFSAEALAMLLNPPHMARICFEAYRRACAKEKT